MSDYLMVTVELAARQIYWRIPLVEKTVRKILARRRNDLHYDQDSILAHLRKIGVQRGSLVMLHSAIQGITSGNYLLTARQVLSDVLELVGPDGTIAMPTHPYYPADPGFMHDKAHLTMEYDPDTTPSKVGLITELFRRHKGVKRSLHPLSSLAVMGPLSDELLKDNLNSDKPLPHGIHSAYYRFCMLNGLVVSLGVPLSSRMTICHVAEESRDEKWPIQDFFYERKFRILKRGEWDTCIVRERRPEFVRSLSRSKRRLDFLREEILHESDVSGIRVDWAQAKDVLSFMLQKNARSCYPYYFPWLSR